MDLGLSIGLGKQDSTTSDSNPSTSQAPPSSTEVAPVTSSSSTVEPVASTTVNPTTDASSTTISNVMRSDTISSTTFTTSNTASTTSSSTRPIDTATPPGTITTTTNLPSIIATTPPKSTAPPLISTTKEIPTSAPVNVVTVTTSGTVVRTYTSISYSNYVTYIATTIPDHTGGNEGSSNVGAIAGGVIGGVAAIVLIGLIVILLTKRRPNKHKETGGKADTSNDYNTYATPTVVVDSNYQLASGPLSPSQGIKTGPLVQVYEPAEQHHYAEYNGAVFQSQDQYYNGTPSQSQDQYYNGTHSRSQDQYYSGTPSQSQSHCYNDQQYYSAYYDNTPCHPLQQQEQMIPASTSSTVISSRNVPDEIDYDISRRVSRHVPDAVVPSVPHTR